MQGPRRLVNEIHTKDWMSKHRCMEMKKPLKKKARLQHGPFGPRHCAAPAKLQSTRAVTNEAVDDEALARQLQAEEDAAFEESATIKLHLDTPERHGSAVVCKTQPESISLATVLESLPSHVRERTRVAKSCSSSPRPVLYWCRKVVHTHLHGIHHVRAQNMRCIS